VQLAAPLLQLPTPPLSYPKGFVHLLYQQQTSQCCRGLSVSVFFWSSLFYLDCEMAPPEDQGMAGKKRRLRKKAPEPCSPIEAEDISGGAAKLN